MKFQEGNQHGTKSKGGGRPSRKDEDLREFVVAKAIGKYTKALTNLEGMSDKQFQRIKDMCLPVVVKDMATKLAGHKGEKLEPLSPDVEDKIANAVKEYLNDRTNTKV